MKTLYKRIAHAVMILVMLVSLTATVSAAELREFTAEDEPAEIYAILLETYGEYAADDYKWSLLANAGIIDNFNDIGNHEIGSKDQYKFADRLIAADEANWIIRKANKTGAYAPNVDYTAPEAQVFDDVEPGSWYYEAINAMAAGGLLTGYTDGLFHPDDPITVGQLCTVLAKIYGLNTTEWQWSYYKYMTYQPSTREAGWYPNNFTVSLIEPVWVTVYEGPDHWAEIANSELAYVAGVYKPIDPSYLDEPMLRRGIMFPMVQVRQAYYNQFEWGLDIEDESLTWDNIPDANACLAELYLNEDGSNLKQIAVNSCGTPLIDNYNPAITNYARTESACYILSAYRWGITTGVDKNGTFDPDAVVTRAQLCQMLYNMKLTKANMLDPSKRGGFF